MALWGISTTQETWANNYAIPKFLDDQDRNNTPHNCFADDRGWIYRRYSTDTHSGLGTIYTDEVLVPIAGLNTVAAGRTPVVPPAATVISLLLLGSSKKTETGVAGARPV